MQISLAKFFKIKQFYFLYLTKFISKKKNFKHSYNKIFK